MEIKRKANIFEGKEFTLSFRGFLLFTNIRNLHITKERSLRIFKNKKVLVEQLFLRIFLAES